MSSRKKPVLIHGVKPYPLRKHEEYMSEGQVDHFKQILQNWYTELTDDTSKTLGHIQEETANHPDPADRASQETDMALELRERDRDRKLLKKLGDTLSALESGDFGYCENCGEEIGLRRLEARPTAVLCVDCKNLAEIKEKAGG